MRHKDMEVNIPGISGNYMDTDNENTVSIKDYTLESLPPIYKYHIEHWDLCVTLSSENNEVPIIVTFDLSTNQESWEWDLSWQNIPIPDPHL